ncbi:GumC family protein [Reyranella soli]|uniref:non-specific protein-tyrosine kinase n=1 Tax=Reyranella soli TaxID=1230389 RepID=A0A512NFG9_9HYPH|nr:polysaccharide biosynthesis tyrosine autokinase [Reyranella soli]GEP57686.1 protein-tyrosine kinase [Reyranella soli]
MAYAQDATPPARRRVALRTVPPTPHYLAEPVARLAAPAEEQSFLETLRKLWRHRLLIAACTVVLGGTAIVAAWLMPSYYVSEARVLVGVQNPRLPNVESIVADVSPDAERVQNEGFILQSRNIAKQVIDQLKLRENPEYNPELAPPSLWARLNPMQYLPPQLTAWVDRQTTSTKKVEPIKDPSNADDRTIDALLGHIDVSTLGRSHVLSVKAESRNPQTASAIANALAERYLDYQRRDKIDAMDRVDKFLMGRVAELRDAVRKSDQAVEDYRRANDLYKSAGSGGGVTSQQLTELNTQLLAAQTAKAEADSRLKEAQEMRKGGLNSESVPEVLRSPLISALRSQQADADRKAAELQATYGPRHPSMLNARSESGNIQARINTEVAKIIDGLGREARTADARYQALAQNFETLKKQMGSVNDKAIGLEALERDAVVNRNLLEAMLLRAKQSTGAGDILTANAKLVSPASPSQAPSYPPKALLAMLGVAGGMMVGVAVALLREGGDHTFRRADQIEALTGLPVMAMVPQVAGRNQPAMQVLRQPTSAYSEALRRLHIGVELSETANSPKTILISSATPSEGKSVMVASLGRLLASNGKRVLLIDCDWRSPRLHQIFRCSNRDGLASLLVDKASDLENTIHHDALSGVDVMPSGAWSPRSAHLLSSDRMRHLLEALEQHYEFIILDTPPALVTADVLALSRLVEKVVFVVRWGHTRQEAVLEALKQIVDAQGDVAGVVMSRVVSKQYRQYSYGDPFFEAKRSGAGART